MAISRMDMERQLRAGGGIMTLEEPRQGYFLGKIVRKAKKAVKKVVKSPIGKAALFAGLGAYGLGALGGKSFALKNAFNLANMKAGLGTIGSAFGSQGKLSTLGDLFRVGGKAGAKFSVPRILGGALAGTAIAAPFFMGGDEEEIDIAAPSEEGGESEDPVQSSDDYESDQDDRRDERRRRPRVIVVRAGGRSGGGGGGGDDANNKRRVREADKVVVPKFPKVGRFLQWRIQVTNNLVSASGRTDAKEVSWLNEVFGSEATYESLAESGPKRFQSLDLKLGASLSAIIRDSEAQTLIDDLERHASEAMKSGSVVKGRQVYWMINSFFKTNPALGLVYDVTDLGALTWLGDKQVHNFRHLWTQMTSNMKSALSEETLESLLHRCMENSTVLKPDLQHYNRQDVGHPDRSYSYLLKCLDRYIDRSSQKQRRDEQVQHFNQLKKRGKADNHNGGSDAAPAPGDQSKGKGKGKTKSSDKSQRKKGSGKGEAQKKQQENKPKSDAGKTGSGDGNQKKGKKKKPCIYFHHKGCNRPANKCMFSHDLISAAEKAKLPKPARDQSQPPAKTGKKPIWCEAFLSEKGCDAKNCTLLHWTEDMVRTAKEAEAKAKKNKKQSGGMS